MQGLALKNVSLRVKNQKGKVVYQEQGELLFTHFWPLRSPGAQRQRPYAGLCQGAVHLCHRPEAGSGGTEVGRPAGRELSEQANRDFRTSWAV